ncbi:MAG: hypothetical protein ACT4OI_07125 [Methanobacteriota archaeon]
MPEAGRWDYADNVRILIGFLAGAVAVEFLGVGSVLAMGGDGALFAGVLLSLATFLLVFAALLLVPRLLRRRGRSFRLLAVQPMDHVEKEVRSVLGEDGREVRIRVLRTRRREGARIVSAPGLAWWLRLEPVSARVGGKGPGYRTEVVQVGSRVDRDEAAAAARERIAARLAFGEA